MNISHFGATDTGRKRDHNEDDFIAQTLTSDGRYVLAAVIDGCGGHAGGDIAAMIARRAIIEVVQASQPSKYSADTLKQAVTQANNDIIGAQYNPCVQNMCCVATVALFDCERSKVYMAHVGDTRLYEYRSSSGVLIKRSHDHSPVGQKEESGALTEHEAMTHPRRNVVTKALGLGTLTWFDNYIELAEFDLTSRALWLLCSDGLYDMVDSQSMQAVLSSSASLDAEAAMLIDAANKAGGKDNITVVLVNVED